MGFQSLARPFLFITSGLLLSCAGQGGHSDDCGPTLPAPLIYLNSVDGKSYSAGDITIKRTGTGPTSSLWQLQILRNRDWCMRRYDGALTLFLENPPQGIAGSFDPLIFDPSSGDGAQPVSMTLTIQSSVPDGTVTLKLKARESAVSFLYSGQNLLSTASN